MTPEQILQLEKNINYLNVLDKVFIINNILVLIFFGGMLFTLKTWSIVLLLVFIILDLVLVKLIMYLNEEIRKDNIKYVKFLEDKCNEYD